MRQTKTKSLIGRLAPVAAAAVALFSVAAAHAAAPGITGPAFNLSAAAGYINQPDGNQIYSWGYGCAAGSTPTFAPAAMPNAHCEVMQIPAPTLIVTEGATVTVTLTNNLPAAAGNTSILFPGFQVTASGGVTGLLAQEAAPGSSVSYSFVASSPGTHSYYSGTQSDLQVEMGLYGALIVLPSAVPAACTGGLAAKNLAAEAHWHETDFRLSAAAYDHAKTCYDREYLFQFSEMDLNIHRTALAQVNAKAGCTAGAAGCSLEVPTEPYHPGYYLINGRSMPDDMDPNYDGVYPHQPYNGNPHMHPGEQVLLRVIGQGRWEHPFHEHANHVRILARDGNLILTPDGTALAGSLLFTTDTMPGIAFDGIFYFSGRGLNWDMFWHNPTSNDPLAKLACTPDANGYNTGDPTAVNYFEWCQDHNKPLEVNPFGDVPSGGPATLPNPNIFANGAWYGGSPYFGPDATLRSDTTLRNDANGGLSGCVTGTTIVTAPAGTNPTPNCSNLQPSNTQANPPNERGWAFMWHSHNEREITTNNVFPGGMLMMMLVDSREFVIDESQ
jgi:FtsP/CotA-like multicopper oxidase with cupredoxin domain